MFLNENQILLFSITISASLVQEEEYIPSLLLNCSFPEKRNRAATRIPAHFQKTLTRKECRLKMGKARCTTTRHFKESSWCLTSGVVLEQEWVAHNRDLFFALAGSLTRESMRKGETMRSDAHISLCSLLFFVVRRFCSTDLLLLLLLLLGALAESCYSQIATSSCCKRKRTSDAFSLRDSINFPLHCFRWKISIILYL